MQVLQRQMNRLNVLSAGAGSNALLQPSFDLTFPDLGSGVVSTVVARGGVAATFTRATAAYTRLSTLLWAEVASGDPRSYYAADGTYLGYLAEGARTNLALQSNDFTDVAWTKSNMTAAKTATGPDGVVNSASTLTATAGNATALQAITSGSASRIASVFIKRRTGTGVVNITQDNGSTWTAVTVTADWTQVSSTNQTLTNPTVGIRIVTDTDAVDVWCFMNEVGAFASTPIPTVAATVTRNADVLTYPTTGWYNAAAGTLLAMGAQSAILAGSRLAQISDGTNDNRALDLLVGPSSDGRAQIAAGGVTQANFQAGTFTAGVVNKLAIAGAANSANAAVNGVLGTEDTSVTFPAGMTTLYIGQQTDGGNVFYGAISRVSYYPRRLPNSVLVSLTS